MVSRCVGCSKCDWIGHYCSDILNNIILIKIINNNIPIIIGHYQMKASSQPHQIPQGKSVIDQKEDSNDSANFLLPSRIFFESLLPSD